MFDSQREHALGFREWPTADGRSLGKTFGEADIQNDLMFG